MTGNEILEGGTVSRPFEVLELEHVDEMAGGCVTRARVLHSRSVGAEISQFPSERLGHKGAGDWWLPSFGSRFITPDARQAARSGASEPWEDCMED